MAFREMSISEFEQKISVFTMIDKEWMAITAPDGEKVNAMTASWGGLGIMWHKNVLTAYVRESRYTEGLLQKCDRFSAAFFGMDRRKELGILGAKSGRDCDKLKEAGLTATELDGVPAIKEADMVLVLRKLYRQKMDKSCFTVPGYDQEFYADNDMHVLYLAEIEKVYVAE